MATAGPAILNLLEKDIKPRDILTPKAFHNAIVITMALGMARRRLRLDHLPVDVDCDVQPRHYIDWCPGGSTNAVLHLLAMARAADVPLTIDDFQVRLPWQ
jgi:dihydroxy-acid dehydratase